MRERVAEKNGNGNDEAELNGDQEQNGRVG